MRTLLYAALLIGLSLAGCESKPHFPKQPKIVLSGVNYKPRPTSELELSEADQRQLLAAARQICNGKAAPVVSETLAQLKRDIIPILYTSTGKRAASKRLIGDETTVSRLSKHLPKLCKKAPKDAKLHLLVVGYTAVLPNFGIKGVFDQKVFEPMVNGLVYEYKGRRIEYDPMMQVEKSLGMDAILESLPFAIGLNRKTATTRNALKIEIYKTLHIGESRTTGTFSQYLRGHQRLQPSEITHELIDTRLALVGDWYRNNVIDGEVTYEYAPSSLKYQNEDRTMVRSTMSVWILNRLAEYLNQSDLKALGDTTIAYYLEAYFQMTRSKKLGQLEPSPVPLANGNLVRNRWTTASFIAAAIMERKDWEDRKEEIELLMNFAMSYKRDDGVLWTENGSSQFFMPGQLLLAVSYAYETTGEERYRTFFDEVFDVYSPALMQLMHMGPKTVTPYAPAWFTQPSARMYQLTGDTKYRDLIYAINDRVVLNYERNAAYQIYEDYDGMLAPKVGSYGNNSITAAALESLVDAAITAQKDGDTQRLTQYRLVVRHAVAFLLRLQFTPENAYYIEKPERVIGGFKKDMTSTLSWMDNVWHLTSAFMKIQESRLFEEPLPE